MDFYHNSHQHYCGTDLHARSLYVCIFGRDGNTLVHKEIPAKPEPLFRLLDGLGGLVVGVECMHCWYWVAGFDENTQFGLFHFNQLTLFSFRASAMHFFASLSDI